MQVFFVFNFCFVFLLFRRHCWPYSNQAAFLIFSHHFLQFLPSFFSPFFFLSLFLFSFSIVTTLFFSSILFLYFLFLYQYECRRVCKVLLLLFSWAHLFKSPTCDKIKGTFIFCVYARVSSRIFFTTSIHRRMRLMGTDREVSYLL